MEHGIKIFGQLLQSEDPDLIAKVLKNTLPETVEYVEFNIFHQDYSVVFDPDTPT